MIRKDVRSIDSLNSQKIMQLKVIARACARGPCCDLATLLDVPIGTADAECIYPPMYKIVNGRFAGSPGALIIMACDVMGAGRSRVVLIMTKADAVKLLDGRGSTPPQPGRAMREEDRAPLKKIAADMMSKFLVPLHPYLPSDFIITPPVVTYDSIKGGALPHKLVKLMICYQLMMEVHFVDRSRRVRGRMIFLPDDYLRQRLMEASDPDGS